LCVVVVVVGRDGRKGREQKGTEAGFMGAGPELLVWVGSGG